MPIIAAVSGGTHEAYCNCDRWRRYVDVRAGGNMELKIIGLTIVLAVLTGLFFRLVARLQVKK